MRIIGGWGDRPDDLRSCAQRLQQSLQLMPNQDDVYGPWGVWRERDDTHLDLEPIDIEDLDALERVIAAVTERVNDGPMRTPGQHIELVREARDHQGNRDRTAFKYRVRAGFVSQPSPYNHILFELDPSTDEALLARYLTALVVAWEPDELAVASRETQRAQGRKPPEAILGWLTYLSPSVHSLDQGALDDAVAVTAREGGWFVSVPGDPSTPSIEHIGLVRRALGYQ